MKKKSLLVAMVTCGILSSVLSGFLVMASNDDIFFTFRIGSYQENGRDSHGRYRQTNDVNNPWKAGLGDGMKDAMDRVADYYLRLADKIFPVLEVDAHEDVLFRHAQPICKMDFEHLLKMPEKLYGVQLNSHYQGQRGPQLGRHFQL